MNNKGFTLVELLTVVVIMGILALIIVPNTTRLLNAGKTKQMITDASTLIAKAKYEYKMGNCVDYVSSEYDNQDCYYLYDNDSNKEAYTFNLFSFFSDDATDGYGDQYKEWKVRYFDGLNDSDDGYWVSLKTNNHCLSNTKDGSCSFIKEENLKDAYVVER